MSRTITKSGRLHGNTRCADCGVRNTTGQVKLDPRDNAPRCGDCVDANRRAAVEARRESDAELIERYRALNSAPQPADVHEQVLHNTRLRVVRDELMVRQLADLGEAIEQLDADGHTEAADALRGQVAKIRESGEPIVAPRTRQDALITTNDPMFR